MGGLIDLESGASDMELEADLRNFRSQCITAE